MELTAFRALDSVVKRIVEVVNAVGADMMAAWENKWLVFVVVKFYETDLALDYVD